MRLTIRYFAALRDAFGRECDVVAVDGAATIGEVVAALSQRDGAWADILAQHPKRRFARNQAFATEADIVQDGDELAIFPPITGG